MLAGCGTHTPGAPRKSIAGGKGHEAQDARARALESVGDKGE